MVKREIQQDDGTIVKIVEQEPNFAPDKKVIKNSMNMEEVANEAARIISNAGVFSTRSSID